MILAFFIAWTFLSVLAGCVLGATIHNADRHESAEARTERFEAWL